MYQQELWLSLNMTDDVINTYLARNKNYMFVCMCLRVNEYMWLVLSAHMWVYKWMCVYDVYLYVCMRLWFYAFMFQAYTKVVYTRTSTFTRWLSIYIFISLTLSFSPLFSASTHIRARAYTHTHAHVYLYAYVCLCRYIFTNICLDDAHAYTNTLRHTNSHIHICISSIHT